MAYKKTLWKDRVVEKPNTYRSVENPDGTITLYPITGQVIEKGTPVSAANLNKIENGIVELNEQLDKKAKQVDLKVQEERINLLTKVQNGETDGNTELLDMRVGPNGEVYSTSGNTVRTIGKALNYKTSKNLFNKNTITDNTSFYADGNINSNSPGYCISDFIPTKLGEKIYGSYDGVSKTIDRYNVYNKEKTLLKSVQYFKEYTVEQDGYIRVQMETSLADKYQIEYDAITSYSEYHTPYYEKTAKESDVELLKNNIDIKNIIVVNQDGLGDYITLNEALNSIKDNSLTNKYLILLHEGIYNVCSYFTPEQINNAEYTDTGFVGLEIGEGIYIEGVGVKEKIIIHGEVATSYAKDKREQISTLNLKGKCGLKNLTVTSKYIRYAIHDDFSHNENMEHDIENCDFINLIGSDGIEFSSGAYGLGTKSGSIVNFNKCFIKPSITYHTNTTFLKPSVVNMENCYVDGEITLWDFNSTGLECILNLYNTRYNNIRHAYNGTEKRQYIKIKGVGNSKSPIICDNSVTYKTAETIEIKNNSSFTIPIGKAVKRTGLKTIEPMYSTDDPKLFYGIAIQTIEGGKSGLIQTNGYINSNFINLTLNVGDKIGVVNGALSIVTGNEVGKVEFDYNDIKLIKLY